MVFALAEYPRDPATYDEHGTGAAGGHPAIQCGSVEGDAPLGGLADGVLFCMDGADAVLLLFAVGVDHRVVEMADFIAVGEPRRGADVT